LILGKLAASERLPVPCFICSAKAGFNFSFSFHHTAANHSIASVCVALQDRDDTRLLRAARLAVPHAAAELEVGRWQHGGAGGGGGGGGGAMG
jgi:hypothetical protein